MPVAGAIAGAGLGAIGGAQKDVRSGNSQSSQSIDVAPAGAQEISARDTAFNAIGSLDARLKAIESSGALNNLDKLLQELGQSPNQQRIDQANALAQSLFSPQQTALNQAFEQQNQQYAARAAQLGRSSADPILAAKLAQEQIRQQAMLNSQQGAFASQEAMNAPSRLFQAQLGGLSGLSQQAVQNRQAVYSLGSEFANNERQYRLATATRYGSNNTTEESGGGLKGAITGFLGGAGSGAMLGRGLQGPAQATPAMSPYAGSSMMFAPAAPSYPSPYASPNYFGGLMGGR